MMLNAQLGRVWVTGATGFLGSSLRDRLNDLGCEVMGLSRSGAAGLACDLTDGEAVRVLVERYRPETVFHLAGLVTARQEPGLAQEMFDQNERATVNLLSAVSRTGCRRFVLAGSVEEDSASSPYGVAKRGAYLWARYFHEQAGLPMVHCRLHLGYGPGQEKTKLIPYLIGSLLAGESPEISSAERQCRFVFVDDVSEAFLLAASAPGLEGKTVNVGAELTTVGALAQLLEGICGTGGTVRYGAPRREREAPPAEWTDPVEWGWRPATGLEAGLRKTVEWMREQQGEIG